MLYLGVGLIYSFGLFLRTRSTNVKGLLVAHELLMLAAVLSTGRRSGTLVLIVAALVIFSMLIVRRPMPMLWLGTVFVILGGVYLAAYWNHEYGATAQAARAIRSEFDPSSGDESSNTYRERERFNVVQTLKAVGPIFGIGFGNEFARFRSLPVLPWWPLQFVTPHDNILWLWLKMGIGGVAVFLGIWTLALKRCLVAFFGPGRSMPLQAAPLVIASTLVMYLAFAQVDLLLMSPRSMVPFAIALAAAFSLRPLAHPSEG